VTVIYLPPPTLLTTQLKRDTLGGDVTVSPNDTKGRGSKIGQKSVTYYLNGTQQLIGSYVVCFPVFVIVAVNN